MNLDRSVYADVQGCTYSCAVVVWWYCQGRSGGVLEYVLLQLLMYIYVSVHYGCDQFSSVAVDGHCREYGCIVHVSTQCRSYRYVQLSVVMVNDMYLLAIRFSHQSASID